MNRDAIQAGKPSAEGSSPISALAVEIEDLLSRIRVDPAVSESQSVECSTLLCEIERRIDSIGKTIVDTAAASAEDVEDAVRLFRDWMVDGHIVRVIGAGRARLAGSIPANRLAHGGARVYIQDDMIPMPHSVKSGGIIAVSASGKTKSVLNDLRNVRKSGARVKSVGIAMSTADEFQALCDVFIGIRQVDMYNPLQALADTEEFVISMLLDAMVVAAGKLAGFDDTKWRYGHENLGPTGPYDTRPFSIDTTLTRLAAPG